MDEYSALMIHIKKRMRYEPTEEQNLQIYLTKVAEQLNSLFVDSMIFPVIFGRHDELQGLFTSALSAASYFRLFEIMCYPVAVTGGIGIGEWTVRMEDGTSAQQQGTAYDRAEEAVKTVSKKKTQRLRIHSSREDGMANYLLNVSKDMLSAQNSIQNRLQLIAEILYPFVENRTWIRFENHGLRLLTLKENFGPAKQMVDKIAKVPEQTISWKKNVYVQEPIFITGEKKEGEEAVILKNVSSSIAVTAKKSRQNVETIMKRGKLLTIRIMDYMALQYIKRYY